MGRVFLPVANQIGVDGMYNFTLIYQTWNQTYLMGFMINRIKIIETTFESKEEALHEIEEIQKAFGLAPSECGILEADQYY